jgi:hypothetical protein
MLPGKEAFPPQMIITLPVQMAVWLVRGVGAPIKLVAVQLSVKGLYLPPELSNAQQLEELLPPHTIISFPVQTAV